MFANQTEDGASTETDQENSADGENQFFDERSAIHEKYWIAVDANRRNGPQILQSDELTVKKTDNGVSGVVDDYRFFNGEKKEMIEEITGEKDMYGLRKYRQDFDEPDEDVWIEEGSDHFGINIVGVHKIPADEADERFNIDYSDDEVDPVFVPILETEDGEEVIYEPVDLYDSDETQGEPTGEDPDGTTDTAHPEEEAETEAEPDFPADPDVVMSHLEEQPLSDLTLQAEATLAKLRDPTQTNTEIAKDIDCSKNTVRNGLMKFLGEDGYEDLKERGKELKSQETEDQSDEYSEKMMATTDGGSVEESTEAETVEVDAEAFAELEGRIERLESMFSDELLERI